MSPEERYQFVRKARHEAFGEELANLLFFEEEAYEKYMLNQQALLEDTGRKPEDRQTTIQALRDELRRKLASRGTYISFAEDRQIWRAN